MPINFVPKVTGNLVGQMLIVFAVHAPPIIFSSLLAELKTNESVADIWQTVLVSSR